MGTCHSARLCARWPNSSCTWRRATPSSRPCGSLRRSSAGRIRAPAALAPRPGWPARLATSFRSSPASVFRFIRKRNRKQNVVVRFCDPRRKNKKEKAVIPVGSSPTACAGMASDRRAPPVADPGRLIYATWPVKDTESVFSQKDVNNAKTGTIFYKKRERERHTLKSCRLLTHSTCCFSQKGSGFNAHKPARWLASVICTCSVSARSRRQHPCRASIRTTTLFVGEEPLLKEEDRKKPMSLLCKKRPTEKKRLP